MRSTRRAAKAFVAGLRANTTLLALVLGDKDRIRRRVGAANVPGVEYTILDDHLDELMAPVDVQFSLFAESFEALDAMEEQVFLTLLPDDTAPTIGGETMLVVYTGGRNVEDPAEGVLHRAVDFQFTLTRR